jgi:hypothetical protein
MKPHIQDKLAAQRTGADIAVMDCADGLLVEDPQACGLSQRFINQGTVLAGIQSPRSGGGLQPAITR